MLLGIRYLFALLVWALNNRENGLAVIKMSYGQNGSLDSMVSCINHPTIIDNRIWQTNKSSIFICNDRNMMYI